MNLFRIAVIVKVVFGLFELAVQQADSLLITIAPHQRIKAMTSYLIPKHLRPNKFRFW